MTQACLLCFPGSKSKHLNRHFACHAIWIEIIDKAHNDDQA